MNFDLRSERWIPAKKADGTICFVGIEELIRTAHELVRIETLSPLETISLYRLLVGVSHHLVGEIQTVNEWAAIYKGGQFDDKQVNWYFHKSPWQDHFNLFDDAFPFWQFPGLTNTQPDGKTPRAVPATDLMNDFPSGSTKTLFVHAMDHDPVPFTPAEAVRGLVAAQYYALGGLNKKTSNFFGSQSSYYHAGLVGGISALIVGKTIFETIVLNMLPKICRGPRLKALPLGLPPWAESHDLATNVNRVATTKNPATKPPSYLGYLLPRSRHVRLVPRADDNGLVTVREIHIAQGVAWDRVQEPWFFLVDDKKKGLRYPFSYKPEQSTLRNMVTFLGEPTKTDDTLRIPAKNLTAYSALMETLPSEGRPPVVNLHVFALANKKAKNLDMRHETIIFTVKALEATEVEREIITTTETINRIGKILLVSIKTFYDEIFRDYRPRQSRSMKKTIRSASLRTYWFRTEPLIRAILIKPEASGDCIRECIQEAKNLFEQMMSGVTDYRRFPARARASHLFERLIKNLE